MTDKDNFRFYSSLVVLGISSVTVQLIIIREAMSAFGGNELIISITLGIWLFAASAGSYAGGKFRGRISPYKLLYTGHIFTAVFPFLMITALRSAPLFITRGLLPGITSIISGSIGVSFFFCFITSAMVPVTGLLNVKNISPVKVYITDTIGDISGGLMFSLIFVYFLSHWNTLVVLLLFNMVAAYIMIYDSGARKLYISLILLFSLIALLCTGFQKPTLSWRYPGQEIILSKNTPYGRLTITKSDNQINLFQDAVPLFSSGDTDSEIIAHLPLCQVDQGSDVLLISGGIFGTIQEILKHKPDKIDYIELDPEIFLFDIIFDNSLKNSKIKTYATDGRMFIRRTEKKYDAVICDLPDPNNAQLNRFYTMEFFREVRTVLNPGGVFSFSLTGADNYLEGNKLLLNKSIYSALAAVFDYIHIYPGETHYFLASDSLIFSDIEKVITQRQIKTKKLINYDLFTITDPFRTSVLKELLTEESVGPNSDLSLKAFGQSLNLWLEKSGSPKIFFIILIIGSLIFAFLSFNMDAGKFVVMTSGYSAIAIELTLIILFQVIFGYAYLILCFFISFFLLGYAAGGVSAIRYMKNSIKWAISCDLIIILAGLLSIALAVTESGFSNKSSLFFLEYIAMPVLIFATALAAGSQFAAISSKFYSSVTETIGSLYFTDLAGACAGTLITGIYILPKFGILPVLYSVIGIKIISVVWYLISNKKGSSSI